MSNAEEWRSVVANGKIPEFAKMIAHDISAKENIRNDSLGTARSSLIWTVVANLMFVAIGMIAIDMINYLTDVKIIDDVIYLLFGIFTLVNVGFLIITFGFSKTIKHNVVSRYTYFLEDKISDIPDMNAEEINNFRWLIQVLVAEGHEKNVLVQNAINTLNIIKTDVNVV